MTGFCGSSGGSVSPFLTANVTRAEKSVEAAISALRSNLPTINYYTANLGAIDDRFDFDTNIKADINYHESTLVDQKVTQGVDINYPLDKSYTVIKLDKKPVFKGIQPINSIPPAPTINAPEAPKKPDINTSLSIPSPPNLSFGNAPNLTPIKIPTIVALDISDFTANRPSSNIDAPDGDFDYTDAGTYDSNVVNQIENRMQQMADNDWGIPDYIWDLAWEQGREREVSATSQIIDDINTDMAGRGFSLPQGIQLARIDKANQENLAKTITINREQVMAQEKEKTENFRFHVQQGIAFEQVRGSWYNDTQNRILDAAKYAFQASTELFRARVEFFNAQVLIFKTEADVYKIEVDAEVAKLEAQKVELEAQALVSEINKDAVAIYTAEIESLDAKARVYKTQVDAAVSVLEGAKVEVQKYVADINNYSEQIKSTLTEHQQYKIEADVKAIEFQNYSVAAQAFNAQVQAFKTNADAQMVSNQSISEHNKNVVSHYEASIKGVNTDIQAKVSDLEHQLNIYTSKVQAHQVQASVEKMNVDATIAMQGNQIQFASQETQASIQNARSASQTSLASANASVERTNAIGTLYTGLASASISAANISYGHSSSNGISCTTSYQG